MINDLVKAFDEPTVNHKLSLIIISGQNVANCTQTRDDYGDSLMAEQCYELCQQSLVQKVVDAFLGTV